MDARERNRRSPLALVHLVVGAAGIAAFLLTGQFMDRQLDHLRGMPDGLRALYRSVHIYILLLALLHLVLGAYANAAAARIGQWIQALGSVALVMALALFVYGFYHETPLGQVERPMVRLGIELSLAGGLLHAIAGYADRARTKPET